MKISAILLLFIILISCNAVNRTEKTKITPDNSISIEWNKYLNNIEKVIDSTNDKKILLNIKNNMVSLYIEGMDNFDSFPDDISIKISRLSEKIDKKIHKKIIKKNKSFKSIDIVARKLEKNFFFGELDDGSDTQYTEKDLKSDFYWPLKEVYINSPYGFRNDPFEKSKIKFHHGVDMAGKFGDYVMASNYGKVVFTGLNGGYGNMIILSHPNKILTIYGHLSKILVKVGTYVKRGEIIGQVGSTGRSTGPHLHFEIRRNNRSIDPIFFIESQGIK